tara:strand:+ start:4794 stop:6656 length:1863 start_codon:yes stop_codon:yes gene_type:complete
MKNLLLIKRFTDSSKKLSQQWEDICNNYKLKFSRFSNILIISSQIYNLNKNTIIFSEYKQIFFSNKRNIFINICEINKFYNNEIDLISDVEAGNLWPITDSCFCIYEKKKDALILFSSCTGPGTIFYTKIKNEYYFSNHTCYLKNLRKYKISKYGLSEIIRFGANYSEKTLLDQINKIPFAKIAISSKRNFKIKKSYYPKIESINLKDPEFKEIFKKIINSYELNDASILFSTGVDSTVMTEFAKSIKNTELFYMKHLKKSTENRWVQESSGNWKLASENKHHIDELTEEKYIEDAKLNGYQINELTYKKLNLQEFIETIKSYSLPTIEFGILPTKQLLDKSLNYSDNIFDGTGADALFGFLEINTIKVWNLISSLNFLGEICSSILLELFTKGVYFKYLNYVLSIIARIAFSKRAEISHLASNPYSFAQMKLNKKEWQNIEVKIKKEIDELVPKNNSDVDLFFSIGYGVICGIAQFAPKTAHTFLRNNSQIYFPYYHPLMIAYASNFKREDIFSKELGYKKILKKFLFEKGFTSRYIKRTKLGFQPPLIKILSEKEYLPFLNKILKIRYPELDQHFSKKFLNSINDIDCLKKCKTYKELCMIWSYLSIKIWLLEFLENN